MNTLLIFCVVLVSNQLVLASKKSDINPLLFFSQQTTNNCNTPGLQCKDCQTIQYCSSNLDSIFEIHCEDQSRLRPYCDMETNTCVKDKPSVCHIPDTSFHCPGTGYYPDLEDCSNYYYCDENKVATKMSCPILTNWDQSTESCKTYFCRSYSPKLGQCKGKTNKLVSYAPDKNFYVLCLSNGPILLQCPNKWEVFDEAEVRCKFECTQNGLFPHPSDPRKFYSCTKEGKGYVSVTLECPEGYNFVEMGTGVGICTFTTTTTTTTTEAPTTIEDLATILEEQTQADETDPKEEEEEEEEEEHHTEETGDQNDLESNVVEHNSEEIVDENTEVNSENSEETVGQNDSESNVVEHHSEEIVDENAEVSSGNSEDLKPEIDNSGDHSIVEENNEEPAQETQEATGENNTDDIIENNESLLA